MWKSWSSVVATTAFFTLMACADGVKFVQEHENGGVVVYPFRGDQGSLLSSFRQQALALIQEKCGTRSYTIVREGEAQGRSRVVSPMEGQEEVIQERRWGIQFQCI
jgi:hypothetical protein